MKRLRIPVLGPITGLALVFLYVPLVFVFLNAFNADRDLARWGGFTLHWFDIAVSDGRARDDFVTSIVIAVATTAISLVIGVTAALWSRGATTRGRALLDATTYMRIVLPEVVVAVGLFVLFRRLDLGLGTPAILLGHVVFNSALATVILQARVATMGRTLEEAAMDLGASSWRVFRRVTLPQLLPAVVVAGLLTFTFSLDDVITSAFLGGGSTETLPVYILGLVRHQITPQVNAMGAIVMVITLASLAAAVAVAGLRGATGFGTPERPVERP